MLTDSTRRAPQPKLRKPGQSITFVPSREQRRWLKERAAARQLTLSDILRETINRSMEKLPAE